MKVKQIKNTYPYIIYIIAVLLIGGYWALTALEAQAARLYFQPSSDSLEIGESRLVELRLDTEGEYINAAEIIITYPQSLLRVANLYDGSSIFDVFITRPTVVKEGEIFLSAGVTDPFNDDGLILKIAFSAVAEGQASVEVSPDSKVLIADGQGSIVSLQNETGIFTVTSPVSFGGEAASIVLVVFSSTHPDPTQFYSSDQVVISWELADDYEYSYTFSKRIEEPDNEPEERVSSVSFFNVEDGIYFFNLKPINTITGSVGSVVSFRVMIDTTPPEKIKISVDESNATESVVAVISSDKTSGIEFLEFKTAEQPNFQRSESFFFTVSKTGEITVRVYDKAGNIIERSFKTDDTPRFNLTIIILIAIVALIVYFLIERKIRERKRLVGQY